MKIALAVVVLLLLAAIPVTISIRFIRRRKNSSPKKSEPAPFRRRELQDIPAGAVTVSSGFATDWEIFRDAVKLVDERKLDEAIALYNELLLKPGNEEQAYIGLGTCHNQQGKSKEAITYYEKAIAINDKNFASQLGLGSAYYKLGDYHKTLSQMKIANALSPDQPDTYWGLATAHWVLGQKKEAAINAKIFLEKVPDTRYRANLEKMITG